MVLPGSPGADQVVSQPKTIHGILTDILQYGIFIMQAAKGIYNFRQIILGIYLPHRMLDQGRNLRRVALRRFFKPDSIHGLHSLFRMIFPLMVFGSSSLKTTILGYLYGAVCFFT